MVLVYIGLYTLFLSVVWGFFIISKIHAFKFKNFSNYISKVTFILFIVLLILSISGYLVIIFNESLSTNFKLNINNENINDFDISEY